ncbi:MAG: site-specific integrase [Lachnospiraceae bacterium]|nr:site-specific integrase [Lachnospiraceae bacterium]
MRMKTISESRTLRSAANEFLAYKKARKVRERTIKDYQKYIDQFIEQSENSMDIDVLKAELLNYFAEIPTTSPARYNHPYQYLHALFEWCAIQDYLPFNPFDKLGLKKIRDEGKVQPAGIKDIQTVLKSLDKHNYTELRDYNIILLMLDTGIRTSELMAITNDDYDPEAQSILVRAAVAKTSRSRTLYLSNMTNASLRKFLKVKPDAWEQWLFPTRDGKQLKANVLGRNFRKYCQRSGVKFTPYQIRHSFATFYLENGGDLFTLQRQMGHTDLQMTRRYTEISDKLLVECHQNYSPIALLQSSTRKNKV